MRDVGTPSVFNDLEATDVSSATTRDWVPGSGAGEMVEADNGSSLT